MSDHAAPPEQELPLDDLLAEAERIAANMEKDGRYTARTIMRELARRLATPAPSSGAVAQGRDAEDGRG